MLRLRWKLFISIVINVVNVFSDAFIEVVGLKFDFDTVFVRLWVPHDIVFAKMIGIAAVSSLYSDACLFLNLSEARLL